MTRMNAWLLLLAFTGCGKVSSKIPADMAMAATGGDMATAANVDLAGGGGGDTCVAASPCPVAAGNGLCTSSACAACTDTTDDSACATAYGAGNICVGGVCVLGNCHGTSDCGGKACVQNSCAAPCTTDLECTDPNTVCNTTSGACVTNASCAAAALGDKCPINTADRCCGAGTLTCQAAADCCTNAQCPTAGDTCQNGSCVPSACGTPTAGVRYVDSTFAMSNGNGTMACPFQTMQPAISALASGGGTVVVKSGTSYTTTTGVLPKIIITGSDPTFAECNATTCSDSTKWPTVTISATSSGYLSGSGFFFIGAGPSAVRFMKINGPGSANTSNSGVYITNTSSDKITVDNLHVQGFHVGIEVAGTGVATVGTGTQATLNVEGLQADDGAKLTITVASGAAPAKFFANSDDGIVVSGAAKLVMTSTADDLMISSGNTFNGLRLSSSDPGTSIDHASFLNNTQDGIYLFADTHVKLRNNKITGNTKQGIRIVTNGSNTISNIDVGTNTGTNAGANTFSNNGFAGVCITKTVADAVWNACGQKGGASCPGRLMAQGNTFGTTNCATTAGQLDNTQSCDTPSTVADNCRGVYDFTMCTGKNQGANCVSTP